MLAALEIEAARDLGTIQDVVRRIAKPYGYDRFVLFSASSANEDVVERLYWVEGIGLAKAKGLMLRRT